MKYDFIVVGAGFFGATVARQITDAGKTCMVIDKNDHVAGMSYTENMHGINVHIKGAHIVHTNSKKVWDFFNRFAEFNNYTNRVKALAKNKVYSLPLNMMTFSQLWGAQTPKEALQKIEEVKVPCDNPKNLEEWILSMVGREIYELFFYGYTKKHYMTEPHNLPASIVKRLPMRLTYDDNYFNSKYQGIPIGGYTQFIENILEDSTVETGVDFFKIDWKKYAKRLIYSGPLDQFFGYEHGKLDYRTLRFEHKVFDGDYQGNAVFNHCDYETPYLRSVEAKHFEQLGNHKHLNEQKSSDKTVVSFDIPATSEETDDLFYPLVDDKNVELAKKYKVMASNLTDITVGGRLGNYQYLDMDQTAGQALVLADKILN